MSVATYKFWSVADVVASGQVDQGALDQAISTGQIRLITDGQGNQWVSGLEVMQQFGVNLG